MKRLATIFLAASLLTLVPAVPVAADAEAPGNTCVWIYEDGYQDPDVWGKCAPNWSPPGTNNLTLYSNGLVNGCNKTFPNPPGSNWNDCVSSFKYTGLAPNFRFKVYADINYSGPVITCKDADGTVTGTFAGIGYNDAASSWRVEAGNC